MTFINKPTKTGWKTIPREIWRRMWQFWHTNSMVSTLISKLAKWRVSNRKKMQNGLDFVSTVSVIQQRNRNVFLSQWFIINVTIKELFLKYVSSNSEMPVSLRKFLALKRFYILSARIKDMVMCCYKETFACLLIHSSFNSMRH